MKKMRRVAALSLTAVMAASVCLAGCGGNEDTKAGGGQGLLRRKAAIRELLGRMERLRFSSPRQKS